MERGRQDQRSKQVQVTKSPLGHGKDFDFGLRFMRYCWRIFISKIILPSDLHLKNVPLAFVGRPESRQEGQLKIV